MLPAMWTNKSNSSNNYQYTWYTNFQNEKSSLVEILMCIVCLRQKRWKSVTKKVVVIKEIEHLCSLYNLMDMWCYLNCQMSYGKTSFTKFNVDQISFLISKKLSNLVTFCNVLRSPKTDLLAICYIFKPVAKNQNIGLGFQKFNSSPLKDEHFRQDTKNPCKFVWDWVWRHWK